MVTKPKTCATCGTTHFYNECPNGPHDWTDSYNPPDGAYIASDRKTETYYDRHNQTFKEARIRALTNYRWQCSRCGITDLEHRNDDNLWPPGGGLHVHHKIDSGRFENPENSHIAINLIPLCDKCHKHESARS